MPYSVLYYAIYLFSLLLKAIASRQHISQKIEQLFLLYFCFLLVVSYCFCNNMVKKPRLYFCILKVVLSHLYHLCQLHEIIIRPDV